MLAGLAQLDRAKSFRQIGEFADERPLDTLITNRKDVTPPCKHDVYRLTTLGIACAIKALELVAAGNAVAIRAGSAGRALSRPAPPPGATDPHLT